MKELQFTDIEKRIFYAAMTKEAKVCQDMPFKEEGESLRWVCSCIMDKVERTFHVMKSITQQIEDVKNEMCDKYCKYPEKPIPEGKTEDWLWCDDESPCHNCPLNKL